MIQHNDPNLWLHSFPKKTGNHHKFDYGMALIYGSEQLIGASCLAVEACARMGCGYTILLSPTRAISHYQIKLPSHIVVKDLKDFNHQNLRITAKLYGPGGLPCEIATLKDIPTILDADAISYRSKDANSNLLYTPHEGEFERHFVKLPQSQDDRIAVVKTVAVELKSHVLLKGKQTIIADPSGACIVNAHSSPYLATAGTGDVLAGMITGLVAQGMTLLHAAAAATWIHGEIAKSHGPGLVASDLNDRIPEVLKRLLREQ